MPSSLLEIIELANGEFVLQRANGEGEPLVNIRFSDESREYIEGTGLEIAKVMIQAGIQAVAYMNEEQSAEGSGEVSEEEGIKHVLH